MTRRFNESQLVAGQHVAAVATPCLPGFVACSLSHVANPMQQFWQAIYQAAYAQAMKSSQESRPTRYQRLLYHVCLN